MGKRMRMTQFVRGSVAFGELAILLIVETTFATPAVGVEATSLAVGTLDPGNCGF
jgi:hypothetical protein